MTAVWPESWEQVSRCGRVYHLEKFADGFHVVCDLSTIAVVATRQAAIAAVDEFAAKMKSGVDGST
jgi:hypothetical protein